MSDNGPYTQPPQYPGGDSDSGGQPGHYGGGYGGAGQQGEPGGGQPQYPSGPYPSSPYGDSGGQPAYQGGPYGQQPGAPQFQQPHEQQMFQGGQPPYGPGGPGGPGMGMPGYPPQPPAPRKSNAGLWIVIGGGAVILILVVAVVVMLMRNGSSEPAPSAGGGDAGTSQEQEQQSGQEQEGGDEGGTTSAAGEPPYTLTEDPCTAITEEKAAEIGATDPSKYLSDNNSSCTWSVLGEDGTYGTLQVDYSVPYGASDSVEGAKEDFQFNLDYATDETSDILPTKVLEQQDVNLGDEAKLIFSEQESFGNQSVATLLIREDNMNLEIIYTMSPDIMSEGAPAPLEFSDVEGLMPELGKQALNLVGS
ncbi:hypothetical protein ACQEU5_01910 [Marinactinospora thermotolerans]|uniref:DUF3558 domain-containing protein n=1 Tax=Marinactinospora thermotolerans DSM 45154 TaxID=1122192 RepID=A0A1T4M4P2_9ACTN|nr:hypothetical protein [Marinactinospora thermotolerans]SJZ61816.1 hypothetical protein SAMN02745673_00943 [Marinactinospora thermotolerans DSM 45154]